MSLGQRIQMLRKQKGWSQEELGAQLGVSRQAVSKWETDQTLPDSGNLLTLTQLFGVSADEMIAEKQAGRSDQAKTGDRKPSARNVWWLATIIALLVLLAVGLAAGLSRAKTIDRQQTNIPPASDSGQQEAEWTFERPTANGDWGLFWMGPNGPEYLMLGVQDGPLPFGASLSAAKDVTAAGDRKSVTRHTVTCGELSLVYTIAVDAEADPSRYVLWSAETLAKSVTTKRGVSVGSDEAELLAAYDDGNLYYHLKEHGQDLFCQHDHYYIYALAAESWANQISFYMADGKVAGIRIESLSDGAGYDPADNVHGFPLLDGKPDFSRRVEPEKEKVDATRQIYIDLYALTTDENLSAEERYRYRLEIFNNLQYLDWASYGLLGEAGKETETVMELTNWLRAQQNYSGHELLGLQLGVLSGPDGWLAEEYSAILCRALFLYPVEFTEQLADNGNPPENAVQVVGLTAYGADLYPQERALASEVLRRQGLAGEAGDWAEILLHSLENPYEGWPEPPASSRA